MLASYDLISIDPGRDHVAAAFWRECRLQRCILLATPGDQDLGIVVSGLLRSAEATSAWMDASAGHAVVEYMCHHPGRAASQARDLIDVSISGVAIAARLAQTISFIAANQWKGQAPKPVIQRRVLERLDERESAVLAEALLAIRRGRHHDIYDAVGIGLHHLRRL